METELAFFTPHLPSLHFLSLSPSLWQPSFLATIIWRTQIKEAPERKKFGKALIFFLSFYFFAPKLLLDFAKEKNDICRNCFFRQTFVSPSSTNNNRPRITDGKIFNKTKLSNKCCVEKNEKGKFSIWWNKWRYPRVLRLLSFDFLLPLNSTVILLIFLGDDFIRKLDSSFPPKEKKWRYNMPMD